MNNIINPDPLGFRKMEKERVINELKKEIKKAESEGKVSEVKKLENELEELTHESFFDKITKFLKSGIRY
ncbi:hypothetical protein [Fusobacterium polymorphum]|jgi:hypothetical protein|uniref:hypothetical protein n=1 Tax=Fusobacterium nucleatum subsp. polymorphum TaxID=76857 RepID=UPI00300A78B8